MKTLLIIYCISWAILLYDLGSLISFLRTKPKDPVVFFVVHLIVLAPIMAVYVILYSLVKKIKHNRELKKWGKGKKTRILEKKKKNAIKNYEKGIPLPVQDKFIEKGRQLKNIVRDKEYQKILVSLDNLHLPDGCRLGVKLPKCKGSSDRSTLFVTTSSGETCDIFDTIIVEDSPIGAMEFYLLYEIWHYLPLFWYANLAYQDYIYSTEDLMQIRTYRENQKQVDVTPIVSQKDGKYYVSCCYWSNYDGLIRELVEIEIKGNKVVNILEVNYSTLYEKKYGDFFKNNKSHKHSQPKYKLTDYQNRFLQNHLLQLKSPPKTHRKSPPIFHPKKSLKKIAKNTTKNSWFGGVKKRQK